MQRPRVVPVTVRDFARFLRILKTKLVSEYFIIKLCSRLFRRQGEVWMVKSSNGEGCYKHKKESGSVSIVFTLKQMNMSFLLV